MGARTVFSALLAFMLSYCCNSASQAAELGTVYWESAHLLNVKERSAHPDQELKQSLDLLESNAELALRRGPYSVMDKKEVPPSGDKHDYMSFSRYWWPNPETEDGLPYIRKDGQVNRKLRQRGDRDRVGMLMEDVETLSLAAFLLEKESFANHATKLIRVWFLDPKTRMNPNLKYGQAVPGRSVGRGVGIIDTRGFLKILDAVALLSSMDAIEETEVAQLREWFSEYLDWLLTSELGIDEAARENNHGSWYRAQTARIALFVGKKDTASEIVEKIRQKRIAMQFEPDGSQPEELARTQSLHYSLFNLSALSVAARVGEHLGLDLWSSENGDSLRPGIDFLLPYLNKKEKWPHPQIHDYSMSRGTVNLLRMASIRYDDTKYLEPISENSIRHPEFNYAELLFRKKDGSDKTPRDTRIEISTNQKVGKPKYDLPDISGFTRESIKEMVPTEREGTAQVGPTAGEAILRETFRKDRLKDMQQRQGTKSTQAIKLSGGAVSLQDVVLQIDNEEIISSAAGVVTVRLPILIEADAALIVEGASTKEVRLSTDRGALIANAGRLFILDTQVTSWDEQSGSPTEWKSKENFRPFISSYIRSQTFLSGSEFVNLGYHAPTSYGLSLSSQPEREDPTKRAQWPTGILVDNEFRGLYYGFYSYEARAVKIIGNTYTDCILYGIDPHDRSTELVIARNTATGTLEKHGIIGSRGISNSFVFENVSHNNHGSGIMLDRQCKGNIVCNNKVFNNGQGIAIYESRGNIIAENMVVQNKKSGIRVRNSQGTVVVENEIVANGDYGLEIYAKQLDDHAKRMKRGDLYDDFVSVSFFGNVVVGNQGGIVKGNNVSYLAMRDIQTKTNLDQLEASTGLASISLYDQEDTSFGSELKQYSSQLDQVFDDSLPLVELRR